MTSSSLKDSRDPGSSHQICVESLDALRIRSRTAGGAEAAPTGGLRTAVLVDTTPVWTVVWGIVAVLLGAGFVSALRAHWLAEVTSRSMCSDLIAGRQEIVGLAVPLYEPIVSPFSQTPAVWFSWELEHALQSGDQNWFTFEKRQTAAPFWLQDETGRVLIRPRLGSVEAQERLSEKIGPDFAPPYSRAQLREWLLMGEDVEERRHSLNDPAFSRPPVVGDGRGDYQADTASPLPQLPGSNRVTERTLPVGTPVCVIGTARPRADADASDTLEFAGEDLVISTRSSQQIASDRAWELRFYAIGCTVMSAVFVSQITRHLFGTVTWLLVALAVGLELLTLLVFVLRHDYRRQLEERERAADAWELIDEGLQQQGASLAELVEDGGGPAPGEHGAVVVARSVLAPPASEPLPSDDALEQAHHAEAGMAGAFEAAAAALAETAPDPTVSSGCARLSKRMAAAQERVASARLTYNTSMTRLRTRRSQLPGRLVARFVDVPSLRPFEGREMVPPPPSGSVTPKAAPPRQSNFPS